MATSMQALLARVLAVEPRAISFEMRDGVVILTQADETGLAQLIVLDLGQLQALTSAVQDDIAATQRRRSRAVQKRSVKAIEPWGPIG